MGFGVWVCLEEINLLWEFQSYVKTGHSHPPVIPLYPPPRVIHLFIVLGVHSRSLPGHHYPLSQSLHSFFPFSPLFIILLRLVLHLHYIHDLFSPPPPPTIHFQRFLHFLPLAPFTVLTHSTCISSIHLLSPPPPPFAYAPLSHH